MSVNATLGLVVGNRGFFPKHLVEAGRKDMLAILKKAGIEAICLTPDETPMGSVESLEDARKCAELFRKHSDKIEGILVTLPNFGDERAIANTLRYAGLDVPILIHAWADDPEKMQLANRRDSFCGKMSVCNNLVQYGIPFSLTSRHTVDPHSELFAFDMAKFMQICRVVNGLKSARIGAVGARTSPFNTVRYSEKLLEMDGISVETLDLSDVFGWIDKLKDNDEEVVAKLQAIDDYAPITGDVNRPGALRMAKFYTALDRWLRDNAINALALQCWTSIEENFGIVPCGVMSMLSESLLPAACEVDVMGAVAMYALQLATNSPSALVDWNNNFGDDPDLAVLFHCSNFARSFFRDMRLGPQDIISQTVGEENAFGTCLGSLKEGDLTFARLSTDDTEGVIRGYIGTAEVIEDEPATFGGRGIIRVKNLQSLLHYICEMGFEHHVAINYGSCAESLHESFVKYMGWEVALFGDAE